MRSVSVTLRIADEGKIDPMPFRPFPVEMMIRSDDGCSFKLDLAGGWYLEIKLTDNGVVKGFLTYCKLPIPHSSVRVNDKNTTTDLDGRFEVEVGDAEELHIDITVPVQVCDALHEFLKAEECKKPKASLVDWLGTPGKVWELFRKCEESKTKRWRKVAAGINLESNHMALLLKAWLASILKMAEQAKKKAESGKESCKGAR